ncbi:hypothetical protein L1049_006558 [Liquidambar formosana]|uniref:Uncharacterized protein n=1 Tax=Liquidambar formosana TaxID=63359 RepID=A0AAP0RG29_LIQFO
MVRKAASSLIICCFLLIIFPHLAPQAQASRKLADAPQYKEDPNPSGNGEDDGHKIGVGGSTSRRAGSATGNSPPATIQNSPPAPTTKIAYEGVANNGSSVTKKSSTSGPNSSELSNVTSSDGSTVTSRSSSTGNGNTNSTSVVRSSDGSSVISNGTTTVVTANGAGPIIFSPSGISFGNGPPEQRPPPYFYPAPPQLQGP